jgi:hypothetical protein
MKQGDTVVVDAPSEYGTRINANLLFDLRESEREVGKLKDYIYGLKMLVALLVFFMIFCAIDMMFRMIGLFKSSLGNVFVG